MPTIEIHDLSSAVTKGVRACTQKQRYPYSHFLSYDKLSNTHKSFLGLLNTLAISKTVDEALTSTD